MPKLTIVAHITAKPDNIELARGELEKLIEPTRAEDGCLQYDLHQDDQNPTHFMFFENWESRDLWQAHMDSPHLKAFSEATEGMVDTVTIYEMTHIV